MHCFITCVSFDTVSLAADQSWLPTPGTTTVQKKREKREKKTPFLPVEATVECWH